MNEIAQDAQLLRRYAEEKSETAFADLVRRHLDLVYSAALRRLGGDAHAAADVAQHVFTTLARDAAKLSHHGVLTAWLYTATRNAAIDLIRSEQRRATREQEATAMQTLSAASPDADWEKLRPVLDDVMDELSDADRTAVLLRFFEKRPFAEIGVALQLSDDAARMRVERALEKLRSQLARRGVTSTTAALGLALEANAVTISPAGFAGVLTSSVLGGMTATGSVTGLVGFLNSVKFATTMAMVAALASVGAALFLDQENRAAAGALALALEENAAASARLEALTQKARAAAQAVTVFQQALDEKRSVAADVARMPRGAPGPTVTTEAFLAAHPEAQSLIDIMIDRAFETSFGAALQTLDLAPEERAQIVAAMRKVTPWTGNFGEIVFTVNRSDDQASGQYGAVVFDRLHELLGEERFQRYIEARRWEEVNTLVRNVATSFQGSDTPFPPEEARAAIEIIKRNSSNRGDGRMRHGISVNWPVVARELEPVVSPAQLAALSAAHTNAVSQRSLFRFHDAVSPMPEVAKPNPTK